MPHLERLNKANATERMTTKFAVGEFWRRLSHLDKFNTCQWHSACTKFGHSDNLITLSQALAYIYRRGNNTFYFTRGPHASIYGFSCFPQWDASLLYFVSINSIINLINLQAL